MKNWRARWSAVQDLIHCSVQRIFHEARRFSLVKRQQSRGGRAWWQKDLKELMRHLQQGQARGSAGLSLQSIKDVAQWSPRVRIAVLVSTYAVVLIVGGTGLWSGTQTRISLLALDLQALQSRYLRTAQQVDLLPVVQSQNVQIVEQFGALLDAIPAALESVHILTQMNQAAKDAGLYLELFKPLPEETQPYYVVLPVEVRFRGDYNAMARFMEKVAKMKHLVTFDIVMVPSVSHEQQIVLVSLLKAYRYRNLSPQQIQKAAP